MDNKHNEVKQYYGEELTSTDDLKTSACCTISPPPPHIRECLSLIHEDVLNKYYGCGLTIPYQLEGLKILDLGSGSGRDCFIASKLVGQEGYVIGVDMTDSQLEVANKYIDYHTNTFNYKYANTKFVKGNIEKLDELQLEEGSFDLIVSNCVINLAVDKLKVLKDAFKLLKPGGEMYFSDVYSDCRISKELQDNPVLWGECLSGALYWNDFLNIAKMAGFTDPRNVDSKPIEITNQELSDKLGLIEFFSVTYRLFKLDGLENDCEDYGQSVSYKGTIKGLDHAFKLDEHHLFPTGKMITVCGNTYNMLFETRFKDHFNFHGNFNKHYGIFEGCGGKIPFSETNNSDISCC